MSLGARADEALFSAPLHITREVFDSLSNVTASIDEYCAGNRVVSIHGTRTAIADYEKGELIEIDRAAGTYSITRFEEIARARSRKSAPTTAAARIGDWSTKTLAPRSIAGRVGDTVQSEVATREGRQRLEVTADRALSLRKAAIEVLIGIAYPNEHDARGEVLLKALRPESGRLEASGAGAEILYRLPLEESFSIDVEGAQIEIRKTITRLGSEIAPPNLTAIPPGAKLVESDIVLRSRLLEELDRLPSQPRQ